jgi:hypothetical protein
MLRWPKLDKNKKLVRGKISHINKGKGLVSRHHSRSFAVAAHHLAIFTSKAELGHRRHVVVVSFISGGLETGGLNIAFAGIRRIMSQCICGQGNTYAGVKHGISEGISSRMQLLGRGAGSVERQSEGLIGSIARLPESMVTFVTFPCFAYYSFEFGYHRSHCVAHYSFVFGYHRSLPSQSRRQAQSVRKPCSNSKDHGFVDAGRAGHGGSHRVGRVLGNPEAKAAVRALLFGEGDAGFAVHIVSHESSGTFLHNHSAVVSNFSLFDTSIKHRISGRSSQWQKASIGSHDKEGQADNSIKHDSAGTFLHNQSAVA